MESEQLLNLASIGVSTHNRSRLLRYSQLSPALLLLIIEAPHRRRCRIGEILVRPRVCPLDRPPGVRGPH